MGLENQVWIACVLPWLDRTYRAFGAKESKLCFAHAVHARCEPAVTSSDDSGVVVMVSRPSAVPNGPGELTCALRVFCLGLALRSVEFPCAEFSGDREWGVPPFMLLKAKNLY